MTDTWTQRPGCDFEWKSELATSPDHKCVCRFHVNPMLFDDNPLVVLHECSCGIVRTDDQIKQEERFNGF